MHPQPRVSSSSGVPSNKHAGVAEAESHKPNLSAAAKKAHEDIILDEAKAIKAKLKKNAEWAKANPFVEPPRRKSHWDFVLEEMAWMANDFMQERLWRIAAAAQVCRWVTQERGQTDFRARNLYQKQRKDACMLATAVMKYWQSAEALLCMEKHGASMQHGSSTSISQKSLNDGEAVAKEIDETNTIEVCNKDLEVEKLHNLSHLPIQEYCIRFLRDTKGSDFSVQAEAPSTPDRLSVAGILEPSWEDHFPEESLFYTTPYGAMEAYRNSVESYWASVENHEGMLQEENAEAWTDTDAQAGTEASDEALGPFKCGMSDFADDTRSHSGLSPHEISFGGDGRYLPGAFEGSKATKIARKKRKSIIKASMPKTYVGRIPAGESHGLYLGNNAETNASIPSPLTTGKRTLPSGNSNVGVIPTKRIRSSTVAARQRAAGSLSAGTTSALALATKTDASSGDTSSLQEEFNTFVGGSQPRKNIDIDPSRAYGKHFHFDGADVSVKYKKKKKSKHFGMGASSTAVDTAGNLVPSGKGLEYEQRWQQDSISQHEQNDNQEQKLRAPVHYSHELAISQRCSNSLTGGFMTPLDLCDQAPTNTDMVPHTYQLQSSHASGLGMPNSLGAVSAVQPTSAEIPLLQGTCNLPLGTGLGASSAALNVAPSARDVQRFASVRPISGSMDEQQQQQRMQQYNHMVAGRSLQSPGISVSVGLPVGLPNSNDRGVRMLTSGNAAGMMSGLNRGMPLPRPGFPGVGSPGILSIASSGMSNMLPCSGVGLPVTCTVTSGAISGPGNMLPRSRDNMQMLQPGQSTEEQRQMLMQELQLQAAQGKGQPAASLNNLSNSFSNQMVSSPIQNFSVPHQIPQGHSNLHHSQLQNPNHNQQQQAYMIRLAKERQLQQHQRFLQQQQQFPANGTLLPQSQPHPLSQTQHTMPSMPNIPYQQQHSLPQHVLQQQHTSAQQQSKSQSPPTLQHQASQQSAASSMNPSIMQNPQKRQLSLSQTPGQSSQVAAQSNLQQNQIQKQHQQRPQQLQQQQKHLAQPQQQQKHQTQAQQQQHVKVSKGIERGSMAMQNLSAEPGHANPLQGPVPGNQLPEKGEQMVHLASGQRIFPGSGSLQSGKQMIQAGMAGQQGQGPGQAPISLSSTSTLCQQQKGFSQQSSSKQQTQISLPTENHQGSVPSSAQQQQQLPACQQHSSSVPAPPSASSSQQQQRQSGQPHQPIHRRLTLRQTGSDVGLQAPLQLGKNCIQQQDHVTSQLPSQPGQATFQTGAQMGCSLSTVSATPAVPLASAISSASTVHSAQRKPGQSIPQTTGAPYNASSNNSVSSTLISPVVNSSGTITSSNGNAVVPSPTTSGILSPGTGIGGLSQRQYAGSIGGHSVGALSAIGSRPVQQMGAQWHPQHPPSQQQQHGHNGTQSSTTNSVGSSYVEPPTSGPM